MNEREIVKKSYEALERARRRPANEQWQRLVDTGIIDEQGDVQLWWDAFLAVIAVKTASSGKIQFFRCLKPAFGMPGAALIDVSRESLANYIGMENKRVITAYLNEEQNRWKEGEVVHLTQQGYFRTDANGSEADNLGNMPEFNTVHSQL